MFERRSVLVKILAACALIALAGAASAVLYTCRIAMVMSGW